MDGQALRGDTQTAQALVSTAVDQAGAPQADPLQADTPGMAKRSRSME
jgi:hypothetical protein